MWQFCDCSVPEDVIAHRDLESAGLNRAVVDILTRYFPLRNSRLSRTLQLVLSSLATWAPAFALVYKLGHAVHDKRVPATHMLPVQAVFPFVKLFSSSRLLAFEVSASVLLIWCRGWFRHAPSPPAKILATTASVLRSSAGCPAVARHADLLGCDLAVVLWPLLNSLLSEILESAEWLRLWDFFMCYMERPELLPVAVVATVRLLSTQLLACKDSHSFSQTLRRISPRVKVGDIVKHTRRIYATLDADVVMDLRPDPDVDGHEVDRTVNNEETDVPGVQPRFLTSDTGAYCEFPQASQKCLNLKKQQLEGIARFQQERAEHGDLVALNQELENETLAALRQTDLEQRRLIDAMTRASFDAATNAEGAADAIRDAINGNPTAGHGYDQRELQRLRSTYEVAIAAQKKASQAVVEQLHWTKRELLHEDVRTALPGATRERNSKMPYSFRELRALREHIQNGFS